MCIEINGREGLLLSNIHIFSRYRLLFYIIGNQYLIILKKIFLIIIIMIFIHEYLNYTLAKARGLYDYIYGQPNFLIT